MPRCREFSEKYRKRRVLNSKTIWRTLFTALGRKGAF